MGNLFDLSEKGALVTGASGGIGGAIARALHGAGAKVVLSGTREDALNALAGELGDGAHVVTARLGDEGAADTLIQESEEALGSLDILVNNAGITRDMLSMRLTDEDWAAVLDINLTSVFRLSRAAMRPMMKNKWGRIINITSIVGVTGNAGQANYAASKAGMIGMTKSIAQEVAPRGITANCIAPGFIDTAMTEGLGDSIKEKLLGAIPAKRLGTSEDIAGAAVYLASDGAAYVTGQTLHINGGMAMI
ncbi:MAG: 3-oxoacyl-[acyl-carrier-protein] reductase [Rhodospirillaceae bacterium]|nr:3-oxoacyl-[acyl-carrier-protein] reductase [Rhodospirillaceae bacterium]MBL25348.1 3-oxoacyl-[acyl-carrier-protein] reductase [Rhodospirillaceae bacterium]